MYEIFGFSDTSPAAKIERATCLNLNNHATTQQKATAFTYHNPQDTLWCNITKM
jgi:hypothetical protein